MASSGDPTEDLAADELLADGSTANHSTGVRAAGDLAPEDELEDEDEADGIVGSLAHRRRQRSWCDIRAERQAKLDAYLAENAAALDSFLHRPMGRNGVPMMLFSKFSAVFPDIWGTPDEYMGPQGFFKNPFKPDSPVPFGFGITTLPNGLQVAQLTCAGCHTGRVIGPDGKVITLIGAPNNLFNQFRGSIEDSARDPRFFAVFGKNPLTVGFLEKLMQGRQLSDSTLGAYTYNPQRVHNPPDHHDRATPGYLDAIGVAMPLFTIPEVLDPAGAARIIVAVMPPAPAQVDIMSMWRQRARALAQWDGSIASPVYRNLAAAVGVVSDPTAVDYENAKLSADLSRDLPPPPYPFDVDMKKARKGEKLYARYCAGCHYDNNATIFATSRTGTDPNRALTIQNEGRLRLTAALRAACTDPATCNLPDDQIIRNLDVTGRGYVAEPLDGIWARAPYMHNGAVPTLYHVLMPKKRPATFIRGSLRYDQRKVGFVWNESAASDPYTHVFDTTRAGASNRGHDTAEFNGINWSRYPDKRDALLEYLKTL